MYVKSLIIEGFKSYGQRTEIKGFDKEFNAITGLNGSGKSNILDAICFVLGISNLGHVRAGSFQELVYKNGQAGITKASVTITFDNRDNRHQPLGFEHFPEITVTRQIVLGGKNKYLLNGVNVLNKNIQDFFCSVQLNVNNPHFLIMQGRITKVLNMKPNEILSMIEEAAGTRMYEAKKIQAQKTIEKKDARLKEITTLADEEVAPKIQKLKDERIKYLEYQKVQREAEYLSKVYIAWRYVKEKENEIKAGEDLENLLKKIENMNQVIRASETKEKEIEAEIEQLQKQRGSDLTNKLTELEKKLKEEEKLEMKKVSGIKALKDSITSEENKKKQLGKNLKEEDNLLKAKETTMKNATDEFETLRENEKADAEALLKAQARYQAACSGMFVNEDGSAGTLQDRLIDVRQRLSDAESELKCSQMELEHNTKELRMKEPEANKSNTDYTRDTQQMNLAENDLKRIEEQMAKLNHEGEFRQLQQKRAALRQEVDQLKSQISNIEMRHPSISFHYRDPVTNFDRRSVYGVVCRLMKLKDPKFATALEIAAGGKLYQVIVDQDTTSKLLIERGNLLRRTTMIPLNKIIGRRLEPNIVNLSQRKVGEEHVRPAIDLVEFPRELKAAFEYVFSDVLIVTSIKHARELAFDDRIRKKCVTIEGDVVDPGGTLSGGSASKQGSILLVLQELVKLEDILKAKQNELDEVEKKLETIERYIEQYQELSHQQTKKAAEIQALRIRVEYSSHHQTKMEVEGLKKNIDELKQKINDSQKAISSLKRQEKEIENNMKNSKALQEKELKTAEKEMNQLKKKAEESSNRWKQREQEYEMLQLEIEELKKSYAKTENDIKTVEKEMEDLKIKMAVDEQELDQIKKTVAEKEKTVKEQKQEIAKQIQEIQEMTLAKEKLVTERNERQLNVKLLDYEKIKFKDAQKDVHNKIKDILCKYEWIKEEEQYFGQPNGMYDFQNNHNNDFNELSRQVKKLNEQREKLSKTVNSRAISLLGKEEEQYRELMNKKEAVAQDKEKIMKVIDELDEKKREALMRAWEQVNKDFGSIFSSLLPGALARLSPPQGMTVLEGLEVKVGFGQVWKESLGELSGGQRSLVALSLILAMLLFKPAPIYILDEVDAALDLSHTQNIGSMLKTHFKHSQFIVVSLKDGMFTNANVLFRTKFVDGFSTVARFTQTQNDAPEQQNQNNKRKIASK